MMQLYKCFLHASFFILFYLYGGLKRDAVFALPMFARFANF